MDSTTPTPHLNGLENFDLTRPDSAADSTGGHSVTGDTTADRDYDVINSYNFVLRVEGFQNIPLKAVRGINKQNEYEHIQEGGLNDYVHMVRKPISQPFTFQVERYVSQDWLQDAIDPLANGTELVLPLILYIYRSNNHDGKIPARYYVFTNCRVTGVQVGDLDAERSGLHTITNTISYAQMIIVTMPIAGATTDSEIYKFNNNNSENTTNTSHVRTLADIGITKMAELQDKDRDPDESAEDFERRKNAVNYRGNRSVNEMSALAMKYQFAEGKGADAKGNLKNTKQVVTQDQTGKSKNELKATAEDKKYKFKSGDGENAVGNTESTDWVVTQNQELSTKEIMENTAAQNRYEFSEDGTTANVENSANIAMPEKTPTTKSSMESKAKKKKYKFKKNNKPNSTNVNTAKPEKRPDTKSEMTGKAKKYSYRTGRHPSAVTDEFEINKSAMQAKAIEYNKQPHYAEQANEPAEIRNEYSFGDPPTLNVVTQENAPAAIRKYPPTRSAREVSEFLKGR